MAELGTFTVTIAADIIDGPAAESAAITIVPNTKYYRDPDADKFYVVKVPDANGSKSLPATLTLPTDVTTGISENIGYTVTVRVPGTEPIVSSFAARPAGSTHSLADLTDGPVPVPVNDALTIREEARAAKDSATASATTAAASATSAAASASAAQTIVLADADGAMAAAVNDTASDVRGALSKVAPLVFTPETYGAAGDGTTTNDTAAIQAAANAALAAGGVLYAEGIYRINSTVQIECDADLSRATLNYYGTSLALRIGSTVPGEVLYGKTISTPTVHFANKPTTGWTAATVGVKVINANTCEFHTAEISNFETGLLAYGDAQGTVHCKFFLGTLRNNKRNLLLDMTAVGWVNSNTFYDGRLMHNPAEGTNVPGTRQIMFSTAYEFNNNVFVNPSIEGDVAENMIEVGYGTNNVFLSPRFEGATPKVVWGVGTSLAAQNMIVGGYRSDFVTITSNATSAGRVNQLIFPGINQFKSESLKAGGQFAGSAAANPALEVYDYNDIGGAWRFQITQQFFKARAGTAFDTARLDPATGRWLFGSGAAAPTMFFGQIGGSGLGTNADIYFSPDNTKDIGPANLRPRYVRAGTAVVTGAAATGSRPAASAAGVGAMFFDTTLNKPIWSTGSAWVDATGATV